MKRLNKLIKCKYDTPIYGVKTNSKEVEPGDLFVAIHGFNVDHHDYIYDAIEKGAVAIISEKMVDIECPLVLVENTNKELYKILSKFYENIQNEFNFIGITGTDGKTTTSTIIYNILKDKLSCCNIGTNGLTYRDKIITLDNTTPSMEKLYSYLLDLNKNSCKWVSMETSSEALLHKRLDGIKYYVGILTNITEDHLNVHKTIKNYVASKALLFKKIVPEGFAVVNGDDKYCDIIKKSCKCKLFTYGLNDYNDFKIENINYKNSKMTFDIIYNNQLFKVDTFLRGVYNAYNITAAFICCLKLGLCPSYILNKISTIKTIRGRYEEINFGQNFKIVLDYAHTENGIKAILSTLSVNKKRRLITVTGSAGGREKEKRYNMGKISSDLSDLVIFTMDDPRYERVLDIINDLTKYVKKNNYVIIEDRKKAIFTALKIAQKDDIVAILGKGRDNYMAIGNKKIIYSDYDTIFSYFNN